jgi:hypothetical protein
MGWWMLFGGLLWIIFLVTVIYFIVWSIQGDRAPRRDDSAVEIANAASRAARSTRLSSTGSDTT